MLELIVSLILIGVLAPLHMIGTAVGIARLVELPAPVWDDDVAPC